MLPYRIGFGYDLHRLVEGRKLVLGGVEIPFELGLLGHSDADCLTHAIADGLLGAMGLEDIGCHFPDTAPANKDINSQAILKWVVMKIEEHGYRIGNVDSTIIAEDPKMGPHIKEMKVVLAKTMGIMGEQIGIKATTHEKTGPIGAREAISAYAVCLIVKS